MPCITEVDPMDKAKKKQIKKITTWVLLAALVAGLTAMPLLAKAEAEARAKAEAKKLPKR